MLCQKTKIKVKDIDRYELVALENGGHVKDHAEVWEVLTFNAGSDSRGTYDDADYFITEEEADIFIKKKGLIKG